MMIQYSLRGSGWVTTDWAQWLGTGTAVNRREVVGGAKQGQSASPINQPMPGIVQRGKGMGWCPPLLSISSQWQLFKCLCQWVAWPQLLITDRCPQGRVPYRQYTVFVCHVAVTFPCPWPWWVGFGMPPVHQRQWHAHAPHPLPKAGGWLISAVLLMPFRERCPVHLVVGRRYDTTGGIPIPLPVVVSRLCMDGWMAIGRLRCRSLDTWIGGYSSYESGEGVLKGSSPSGCWFLVYWCWSAGLLLLLFCSAMVGFGCLFLRPCSVYF